MACAMTNVINGAIPLAAMNEDGREEGRLDHRETRSRMDGAVGGWYEIGRVY